MMMTIPTLIRLKTENFCISRNTVKKVQRNLWNWKNICSHVSVKILVSRIYKELLELKNKKVSNKQSMV